jgi:hypothetical protein
MVAIPLSRCRKFSETRSHSSSVQAFPLDLGYQLTVGHSLAIFQSQVQMFHAPAHLVDQFQQFDSRQHRILPGIIPSQRNPIRRNASRCCHIARADILQQREVHQRTNICMINHAPSDS